MLHWPRSRKGHNLQQFWIKLLSVSLLAHGMILLTIFFLYKDDSCQYNMTVSSKNLRLGAPIIFMPFHKVVNEHRITGQLSTSVGAVKTTTVGLASSSETKKAAATLVALQEKKKQQAAQKLKEKKAKQEKLKELQRAKEQEKLERAEKKKSKKQKKLEEQKKLKEKKLEEKKKEEIKPPVVEEPKKEEIKKEVEQSEVAQPQVVNQSEVAQNGGTQEQVAGEQAPYYVGQVEMEELSRQEELQQVISQYWKPPVGLREGLECSLTFVVDADGNASQVTVQKTSGVLVYDMAARMAVAQMSMPQWARGKELSITFI